MEENNTFERIGELEREIAALPQGAVGTKRVRGKEYFYHRYTNCGKRIEDYVDSDSVPALRKQIEKRRELEKELKDLRKELPEEKKLRHRFNCDIFTGQILQKWADGASGYRRRECYSSLHDYIYGERSDRVCILFGLRRTGKTTMLRQMVLDMTPSMREKTAFIQVSSSDTLRSVNQDLRYLEEKGFRYVFIDEVTLMKDFIEGAALFSDIYAASGMKVVLTGTDSLGFILASHDQLYDRAVMIHTTFIPYREFENVLGVKGIENYIRYGGTMSLGGVHYNTGSTFATSDGADEYVDTSIARNIQHSLRYYEDGGHFRLLYDLYMKGELTSAINRVVEDINHRFTKEVLTRTFRSATLSSTSNNLLRDRTASMDLIGSIDSDSVLSSLRAMLDILEKPEQTVWVEDAHAAQIREYLVLLDLVKEIDVVHFPDVNAGRKKDVLTQSGLRYAQTCALVDSLLSDRKFSTLPPSLRERVIERVNSTVEGRMMEDQVLLETKTAYPEKKVFQLQFPAGEFDMVIYSHGTNTSEIYEIKYNRGIYPEQYRYLTDDEKCRETESCFGRITAKSVIYRGETTSRDGIRYINVEEYLKGLGG